MKPVARKLNQGEVVEEAAMELSVKESETPEVVEEPIEVALEEVKATTKETTQSRALELRKAVAQQKAEKPEKEAHIKLEKPQEATVDEAALLEVVEATPEMATVPKVVEQSLEEVMSDLQKSNSMVGQLFVVSFDPNDDPANGWNRRIGRSIGWVDLLNNKVEDALYLLADEVEKDVKSSKSFNASVLVHIDYGVRQTNEVVIDHDAEQGYVNPLWEYTGDEYVVCERWLPRGKQYAQNSVKTVLVTKTKDRDKAIRAFLDHRQMLINKYDSGEFTAGEISLDVPHFNGLPAMTAPETGPKPKKCRVKTCPELAEPGRAWCRAHIEEKEAEKRAK
jgi:hypothetical protein